MNGVASAPQYRAICLLLLDHLPAVIQSSSKVAKLCIGSGSVVENNDRSFYILADYLRARRQLRSKERL